VKSRIIATIYYNTDRHGTRQETGAFDFGEFAKLIQDLRRSKESSAKRSMSYSYVIYSVDDPTSYKELRLFIDDVERIERND
jgi:hypothetical protein